MLKLFGELGSFQLMPGPKKKKKADNTHYQQLKIHPGSTGGHSWAEHPAHLPAQWQAHHCLPTSAAAKDSLGIG